MRNRRFKLELIEKESTRKLTFDKRKASLLKKMSEITVLCDVDAFMIICEPKPNGEPFKLDTVWPSNSDELRRMIGQYKKNDKLRKSYTLSDYFADKKKKSDSETSKLKEKIKAIKYPSWHTRLDNCSLDKLKALVSRLDHKSELARERLDVLQQNQNDVRLHLSENFGNYMIRNDFPIYPHLENKFTLAPSLHVPGSFKPGPSWFVPQQQQQQQQLFLGRGKASEAQIEYENMRSQSATSNVPIWRGQNYVTNLGWKSSSSTL
ncbi:Transcription factor CAULIFLOWER [Euphorbia peplus]|nr:Transcription factor CAULIFLOWER [Euphorbia peplus]